MFEEEPESEEGSEEEAESEEETEEETEEAPPRTVIFEGHDNAQEATREKMIEVIPVREMTERERIQEDQRTKSANERLGKRLPDKEGRPNVYDRIRTPPRETNSNQTQAISPRTTSAIMRENRMSLRKSRTERDRKSTHQEQQRANSNSKEFLAALCGQKTKEEKESTESEDEDKDKITSKSKPKSSKPKK